jgi:uncharacterized surface protein with fasciclin (FAS1) repeats
LLQIAEKNDLVEFGKLVDLADLKKELHNTENVTVFVPSNDAIKVSVNHMRLDAIEVNDLLDFK